MFKIFLGIVGMLAIIFLTLFIFIYNKLALSKSLIDNTWNKITKQLKQNYDLIPVIIDSIRNTQDCEKNIIERAIQLRTIAIRTNLSPEKACFDNDLNQNIKSILRFIEQNEELKNNQSLINLTKEFENNSKKIQITCKTYNNVAKKYNRLLVTFPNNIVCRILNYKKQPLYEIN